MISLTFNTWEELVEFANKIIVSKQERVHDSNIFEKAPTPIAPTVTPTVAPTVTPTVAPVPVATQLPTYTLEQIAVAAVQLKDAGRLAEFKQLLTKFGVVALTQLAPEKLPEFALELQKMGVRL